MLKKLGTKGSSLVTHINACMPHSTEKCGIITCPTPLSLSPLSAVLFHASVRCREERNPFHCEKLGSICAIVLAENFIGTYVLCASASTPVVLCLHSSCIRHLLSSYNNNNINMNNNDIIFGREDSLHLDGLGTGQAQGSIWAVKLMTLNPSI